MTARPSDVGQSTCSCVPKASLVYYTKMGTDIHLVLERRVPDRATIEAKQGLSAVTDTPLPPEVMENCVDQMTITHEWLPVPFFEWLALPDIEFSCRATVFYEHRAASLLSALTLRDVPVDERAPSLWPFLAGIGWRARVRVDGVGKQWLGGRQIDVYKIDDAATAAALLGRVANDVFCQDGPYATLRDRNYGRFGLFSKTAGFVSRRLWRNTSRDDHVEELACMNDGVPPDAHPSYMHERTGEHSDCYCTLQALLATDWNATGDARGRSRRDIMGQGGIDTLLSLQSEIERAGLSAGDFRLLISFDS